jgi:hypothetical protein
LAAGSLGEARVSRLSGPKGDGFGQLDPERFLAAWTAAFVVDLGERLAAERSGGQNHQLLHAVAVLGDRLACLSLYGGLALAYDGLSSLALASLGGLDFMACWFSTRHPHQQAHPKVLLRVLATSPQALPALCLASDGFLLLGLVSHPTVWGALSSAAQPPLLWSPPVAHGLALAAALRHLLMGLQLHASVAALTARSADERFEAAAAAEVEMAAIRDVVHNHLGTSREREQREA